MLHRATAHTPVTGIVLAGGTGTRLGALTRATNKHLLPLGSEPMIYRSIRTLDEAGISNGWDMGVVTGCEHLNAFAAALRPRGHGWTGYLLGQDRPGGIAHALEVARKFAAGDPVVVLLADNVWERSLRPWVEAFRKQVHGARALLSRQESGHDRFGVPVLDGDPAAGGRIVAVEEKPSRPASEYVVTGAYAFDEHVWDVLSSLTPSARGELEITDVLNYYATLGVLEHDVIEGFWGDAGESIEAYYRCCDHVRAHETTNRPQEATSA